MKKRGKKGISPLIATVLLIGFVVAVSAVVMIWGKGFIKERAEKEGALSQAQLECNMIEIEIGDDYKVTNVGSIEIGGFIIREGGDVIKDYNSLPVLDSRGTFTDTETGEEINSNSGVEIVPCIRPEGAGAPLVPCSNKAKKLRGG